MVYGKELQWPVTDMRAYVSEHFALSFYHTALPHIKCFLPVNILTLYFKKNSATACILLYSTVHALPF